MRIYGFDIFPFLFTLLTSLYFLLHLTHIFVLIFPKSDLTDSKKQICLQLKCNKTTYSLCSLNYEILLSWLSMQMKYDTTHDKCICHFLFQYITWFTAIHTLTKSRRLKLKLFFATFDLCFAMFCWNRRTLKSTFV